MAKIAEQADPIVAHGTIPAGIVKRVGAAIGEHPRVLITAAATLGAGVVLKRSDLVRGGTQMLAITVAGAAIKAAVGGEADTADGRGAAARRLSDAAIGGIAAWIAEAAVDALFARFDSDRAGKPARAS